MLYKIKISYFNLQLFQSNITSFKIFTNCKTYCTKGSSSVLLWQDHFGGNVAGIAGTHSRQVCPICVSVVTVTHTGGRYRHRMYFLPRNIMFDAN